jgi:hypothetical protein
MIRVFLIMNLISAQVFSVEDSTVALNERIEQLERELADTRADSVSFAVLLEFHKSTHLLVTQPLLQKDGRMNPNMVTFFGLSQSEEHLLQNAINDAMVATAQALAASPPRLISRDQNSASVELADFSKTGLPIRDALDTRIGSVLVGHRLELFRKIFSIDESVLLNFGVGTVSMEIGVADHGFVKYESFRKLPKGSRTSRGSGTELPVEYRLMLPYIPKDLREKIARQVNQAEGRMFLERLKPADAPSLVPQ